MIESKLVLDLLITSSERHDLILRAAAVDRISSGVSYRKIGEELWVSPQTISGIKKALKENNYRSYLDRSKTERKKKKYSPRFSSGHKPRPSGKRMRTKYGSVYIT